MKKRLVVGLFVMLMALSFAVPAMAADVSVLIVDVVEEGMAEITTFTEMTRIYWRWAPHNPERLQFRVWSITNGRWITDWTYFN